MAPIRRENGAGLRGSYTCRMSQIVHLPDDLAARLQAAADARGVSVEEVAVEAIEARFPLPRSAAGARFRFVGMGDSGPSGGDIGRRHRQVISEANAAKTARDV